jgi:hypothetical protein
MAKMEYLKTEIGSLPRRSAPITSPILLSLTQEQRPNTVVACTTCPNGSWSLSEQLCLTCLCAARRYTAWTPSTDGLILCDDREATLAEQDEPS